MKKIILFIALSLVAITGFSQRFTEAQVKRLWEPRVMPSRINIDSTWGAVFHQPGNSNDSVNGTGDNYAKFTGPHSIGDALLKDQGTFVAVPLMSGFTNGDSTFIIRYYANGIVITAGTLHTSRVGTVQSDTTQAMISYFGSTGFGDTKVQNAALTIEHNKIVSIIGSDSTTVATPSFNISTKVKVRGIPSDSAGLSTGDLYRSGNNIKYKY